MSAQAAVVGLAALGLLFELAGLGLVVRGIRGDRHAARSAAEGASESDLTLTVGTSLTVSYNIEGREVEERVERLESRVAGLAEREHRVRDEVQDYVNRKLSEIEHAGVGRDEALRRFLSDLLEGSLRQRGIGVALFALGAILAAASNVVSAVASG